MIGFFHGICNMIYVYIMTFRLVYSMYSVCRCMYMRGGGGGVS
jgi:hypothetical protein